MIWLENFLQKELGFKHTLELNVYGIAPRRVKNFVNEVNLAMECTEFSVENNCEAVIAFYWMKHFMSEMYDDLPFKDDLIDEIELEYFNGLSVIGNMNSEKVYQQFLKDYSEQAYMDGYLSSYDAFRIEYPMMVDNKDRADVLMEYLKDVEANLQRMIQHEDYM